MEPDEGIRSQMIVDKSQLIQMTKEEARYWWKQIKEAKISHLDDFFTLRQFFHI